MPAALPAVAWPSGTPCCSGAPSTELANSIQRALLARCASDAARRDVRASVLTICKAVPQLGIWPCRAHAQRTHRCLNPGQLSQTRVGALRAVVVGGHAGSKVK